MEYKETYRKWCNNKNLDEEAIKELKLIENDEEEIKDRFYQELEFGTAGLRGVVGIGSNRMNKYTVGKATQGLANFILKNNGEEKGVAIAYDSRNMSKEFAEQTALILNANNIKTYKFDNVAPTPELSFAVRELKCISGIVITASHNPPKYNGYKVYWDDGSQIIDPIDKGIIKEVNNITDFSYIKTISQEEAASKGLYNIIEKDFDDKYITAVKKLNLNIDKMDTSLKIVYTPLHGTGNRLAPRLLNEIGLNNVYVVQEQKNPDGNFPTLSYPNPEDPKSFKLALELAKKVDADIVIANDPDADRIGLHVKDSKSGEYVLFNGNMIGLTIAEYLISERNKKGLLDKNTSLIKTIVSSNMTDEICKQNNVELFEALTGFKNIAARIREVEKNNTYKCIMGFEESYGCLIGDHARDKDGIAAAMVLSEAAAYYKKQGLTLWDNMIRMYEKYGYFKEEQISIVLEGADGASTIKSMMDINRKTPPEYIGKYKVVAVRDYFSSIRKDLISGEESVIDIPKSNVLYYELEDNFWCCVRPSGTEPKIKFYMGVKGISLEDAEIKLQEVIEGMKKMME